MARPLVKKERDLENIVRVEGFVAAKRNKIYQVSYVSEFQATVKTLSTHWPCS